MAKLGQVILKSQLRYISQQRVPSHFREGEEQRRREDGRKRGERGRRAEEEEGEKKKQRMRGRQGREEEGKMREGREKDEAEEMEKVGVHMPVSTKAQLDLIGQSAKDLCIFCLKNGAQIF